MDHCYSRPDPEISSPIIPLVPPEYVEAENLLLILPFPGWLTLIVHGMEVRNFMIPVYVCAANKIENDEECITISQNLNEMNIEI